MVPHTHPPEYFRTDYKPSSNLPIEHPPRYPSKNSKETPLYFEITLRRSILGMKWQRRYWAGVLFRVYSPLKRFRPKSIKPRISMHTTIYREASPDVAKMILELKEILKVRNIWTEEEYRESARKLLGRKAFTPSQLQERRGYFVEGDATKVNDL